MGAVVTALVENVIADERLVLIVLACISSELMICGNQCGKNQIFWCDFLALLLSIFGTIKSRIYAVSLFVLISKLSS